MESILNKNILAADDDERKLRGGERVFSDEGAVLTAANRGAGPLLNNEQETPMKTSNRMKLPELMAAARRLPVAFPLVPAGPAIVPMRLAQTNGPRPKPATVRRPKDKIQNFSFFAPGATSVQLAGDFTKWQEQPINLRKHANGTWWTAVRLETGTHYYRFLVDGDWRDDPECPLVAPNPFGSLNAVRQVYR